MAIAAAILAPERRAFGIRPSPCRGFPAETEYWRIPAFSERGCGARSAARPPRTVFAAPAFTTNADRRAQGIPPLRQDANSTVTSLATCTFGQAIFMAQVREYWRAEQ